MAILEPTKNANTRKIMEEIRQGPPTPRPTHSESFGQQPTDLLGQMRQIVGENLWQGSYDPMRGIAGMTEDYQAALTGYRQTPEGLEQEPGTFRALTLLSPGFGGAPPGTAASGALGRGVGKLFKPFYSEVEQTVANIPQNKAAASQWYQTIKKTPGVKEDELEWMGLREWLNDKKTVTKEELQDFIDMNKVEVKEIVKSNKENYAFNSVEEYQNAIQNAEVAGDWLSADRLTLEMERFAGYGPKGSPKWERPDLVLPGEYSNYREFLFQLPTKDKAKGGFVTIDRDGFINERFNTEAEARAAAAQDENLFWDTAAYPEYQPEQFTTSHWDEPNIVAHVRFNERNINGKNTLFLEEIQSDFAQAGRKHGFKSEKAVNQAKEKFNKAQESLINDFDLVPDRFNARVLYDQQGNKLDITDKDAVFMEGPFKNALDEYRSAWEETMRLSSPNAVPDMPFKKTDQWASLVMKRMIRYAVENDIDQIAWTTGRQQVNRYSNALRQNVDWIKWEKTPDGVHIKGGKGGGTNPPTVEQLEDGRWGVFVDGDIQYRFDVKESAEEAASRIGVREGTTILDTKYKENELSDAIGKSMAKQIIENSNQTGKISGTDITIDDVGMAGFYDRILPNLKFIKKMKGKVKTINLREADTYPVTSGTGKWRLYNRSLDTYMSPETYISEEAAKKALNEMGEYLDPIHIMQITPKMKETAVKGMPMFSITPIPMPSYGENE